MFRRLLLCQPLAFVALPAARGPSAPQVLPAFAAAARLAASGAGSSKPGAGGASGSGSAGAGGAASQKFTKEVTSKDDAEDWDMLDDDVDYWGHLFDEMAEGAFDSPDFIDPDEMKAFIDDDKEFGKFGKPGPKK
jgi:hypothetical protein